MASNKAADVSVIVPLFNKASYVNRCINSILTQTLPPTEIIVVDDGSTDDGAAIVGKYDDRRIRLIMQENAGPGAARNRGLREATGRYVAFLDADDEWMPAYLERGVTALERQQEVAAVSCGYIDVPYKRSSEATWRRRGIADGVIRITPKTSPIFAVHVLTCMSPWSTIARREIVQRYGGFNAGAPPISGEDNELWLKVLLNEPVALYAEALTHWHSEASALSRNRRGPRPIEIFLQNPQTLYECCPPQLREILRRILAIRACKTACMLSFWGQWRQARALATRFSTFADLRQPWVGLGYLCATPAGALAGSIIRGLSALRPGIKQLGSAAWG